MASAGLRGVPLLLLVVLAHYAHLGSLGLLCHSAFISPRLLNGGGLGLGRRNSLLGFGGAMAAAD